MSNCLPTVYLYREKCMNGQFVAMTDPVANLDYMELIATYPSENSLQKRIDMALSLLEGDDSERAQLIRATLEV